MFGNKDDQQQNDQNQAAQFPTPPPVPPSIAEPQPSATLETNVSSDGTAAPTPPLAPPELPGKITKTITPPSHTAAGPGPVSDDLISLKQDALQQLSPLISHLDQTPEERFRTTMMMIQATDDSSKIKDAYEAAQAITDEKARAQALLDIVNEINYFTQHNNQEK